MIVVFFGLLLGLAAGVLSGILGIGGGVIIVPVLVFAGLTQREASGTSLTALLLPVGLLGVLTYSGRNEINFRYAIGIAVGLTLGILAGSKVAGQISNQNLQRLFGLLLLALSVKFLLFTSQ